MKVEKLTLRNFRNIHETSFRPDPRLNFLVGANGQGKTSILEALGYLSTLRSFRGSKSPEVIRYGEKTAEVISDIIPNVVVDRVDNSKISLAAQNGENCGYVENSGDNSAAESFRTELKISFHVTDEFAHKASKTAFINGKPFRSSAQYLSQRFGQFELGFHSIVFNPSDHDLVRGEPSIRRSYLDRVLAAEDVGYLRTLQKYQRVLEQRNAVLKEGLKPSSKPLLLGFTEQLAQHAIALAARRLEWVLSLSNELNEAVQKITPAMPFLRLVYVSNWVPSIENLSIPNNNLASLHFAGHGQLPSLELLEQEFWKKAASLEEAEWRSGHTLVGPHRDDWAFFQGSQVLRGHGSQGEVRSALLALKLCEIDLFRNKTGHRPIFLLDDFSSELDRHRRAFLLQYLAESDLQVFVTTTDESILAGKTYWVSQGNLEDAEQKKSGHEHRVSEFG